MRPRRILILASIASAVALGPASIAARFVLADTEDAERNLGSNAHPSPSELQTGKWALVLSGGGARGLAHIGVLKALEEQRLQPDLIVGTSMGAIVGSLYASGYSTQDITAMLSRIDWSSILYPRTDAFAWKGNITPRPLLRFVVGRRGVQLPSAALDDAFLNVMLSNLLIEGDAAAAGDFDRLPVPFRAVATDLATGRAVVLRNGNVARAVRASMAVPLIFAPITEGSSVLIDGGVSSNLPVTAARRAGADRIVAVDVSALPKDIDSDAPATQVFEQLLSLLLLRGQADTTSASDLLIHLELPGYGSTDYAAYDSLIAHGYRAATDSLRRYAERAGLRHDDRPDRPNLDLPALAEHVEWRGRRSVSDGSARAALGALPEGRFSPAQLRPAMLRLYRSGLFKSAWPSVQARGDSTALVVDVAERPRRELAMSAAFGNDELERFYARIALRNPVPGVIRLLEVAGVHRHYGRALYANAERHALGAGGTGPFVRAEYRDTETRLFRDGVLVALPLTIRREIVAGMQIELPTGLVGQIGAGWTHISESPRHWRATTVIFSAEGAGAVDRAFEAVWVLGPHNHHRVRARVGITPTLGQFTIQPTARAGFARGNLPTDAHVGLGGPRMLSGLQQDEWLGRSYALAEVRLIRRVGAGLSLYASGELGIVHDPVTAPEIAARLQPAGGLGAELTTPFGPIRVHWGIGPVRRTRLDVMLGDRF